MRKTNPARVVTIAFLAAALGFFQVSCGGSSSTTAPPAKPDPNSRVFTSTLVGGHTHTITIQKSEIETPPTGGISRLTSSTVHTHSFTMTEVELTNVKGGTPVVVTTGDTNLHTHGFTIQKWY